eukprot:maker-scaffold_12-snap-gene-12.0-mRNA-1 protein AED:0.02 eAED:0.02 QI:78/1/1/1/1/1/2/291/307
MNSFLRQYPKMFTNIVDTSWLVKTLQKSPESIQPLDCSWYMASTGRNGFEEYQKDHIPSAKYFDVDECSDKTNPLPHMLPTKEQFETYMENQGITQTTPLVLYDGAGIFSAPRAWFMFKAFGVADVAVLDGGFPKYKSEVGDLSIDESSAGKGQLKLPKESPKENVINLDSLLSLLEAGLENKKTVLIDARSEARFTGAQPEPRAGLQSGHIPQSINIPVSAVVENGTFKEKDEIEKFMTAKGFDVEKWKSSDIDQVIFSCGSGVTACIPMIVLVTMFDLPFEKCKLYDGAFSEYGQEELNLDVAKG